MDALCQMFGVTTRAESPREFMERHIHVSTKGSGKSKAITDMGWGLLAIPNNLVAYKGADEFHEPRHKSRATPRECSKFWLPAAKKGVIGSSYASMKDSHLANVARAMLRGSYESGVKIPHDVGQVRATVEACLAELGKRNPAFSPAEFLKDWHPVFERGIYVSAASSINEGKKVSRRPRGASATHFWIEEDEEAPQGFPF